jgi:hypothetical protein
MERLTLKEVMVRVNLSYNGTTSLVRRMRAKGLAREVGTLKVGSILFKVYEMKVSPEEYLFNERQQRIAIPLPIGFFNNPFNLREARDARYQSN